MLGQGLQSSAVDPAAKTRFNNDRARAASLSMGSNAGAAKAVAPVTNRTRRPPVGAVSQPQGALPQIQASPPGPQGQPMPPENMGIGLMPAPTPEEVYDQELQTVLNNMKIEKLMSSPEMHQAVSRSKIQDYYNAKHGINTQEQPMLEKVFANLQQYME